MRGTLALAATGAILVALAAVALGLRRDYRQEKVATLEAPFLSDAVGIEDAGTPARVVFFGDSRVAQWDLSAFERFGPVLNAGFGGDTLAGLAHRLERDVLGSAPHTVVFMAGINDLVAQSMLDEEMRRTAYNTSLAHLDDIFKRLRAHEIRIVLLLVSPPLDVDLRRRFVWGPDIEDTVESLNDHMRGLASTDLEIVDTLAIFSDSGPDWAARVRRDPLHYTPAAYRLLTNAVARTLEDTN